MTISGRTCQDWNSQYPHKHEQTDKIMLRNSRNYCRNPDGEPGGPWCYTNDRNKRWEYCNIPSCRKILPLWIFVYWFSIIIGINIHETQNHAKKNIYYQIISLLLNVWWWGLKIISLVAQVYVWYVFEYTMSFLPSFYELILQYVIIGSNLEHHKCALNNQNL